jgi:HAD superfamily hydrolase (TIGR01509 family)
MTLDESGFTLSRYKAIVFDLDSTLTDTQRYPLQASMWLLEKITDDVDSIGEEYLNHLIINYRKGIKEIVEGAEYRTPYDVVKQSIKESLYALNLEVDTHILEEATRLFRWLHVENSRVYPGVENLLVKLHSNGIRLGVITNSFEKHLYIILYKLKLHSYFKCLVDGGDVKTFKPSPAPFQHVLSCLDVSAQNALFVGDEFYADIYGSTSVGMDAVWVNNRGGDLEKAVSKYGEASRPLLVIESVADLDEYL